MIRCLRCVYPSTKPDLFIDAEGVCSACQAYDQRKTTDWTGRRLELGNLLEDHGNRCIVPVSGGKDSTWQVLKLVKDFGADVLMVNAATDYLTPIGRRNLDNLKRFGTLIEVSPDVEVRKRLCRLGLFEVGDLSWPEHNLIWTAPFREAVQRGYSLIVYGEAPQNEYGGPSGTADQERLDRRWRAEFGGFLGMRTDDLVGRDGLTDRDLYQYTLPPEDEMDRVEAVWLGRYLPWNGAANAIYAGAFGFETLGHAVEGSLGDFENLDNYATGPRDYLRFLKFGYGRATDICCNLIRRGWLSRAEALDIIAQRERFPWRYLDKELAAIVGYFGVTHREFVEVCDRYTNDSIFEHREGRPYKADDGTPVMLP